MFYFLKTSIATKSGQYVDNLNVCRIWYYEDDKKTRKRTNFTTGNESSRESFTFSFILKQILVHLLFRTNKIKICAYNFTK